MSPIVRNQANDRFGSKADIRARRGYVRLRVYVPTTQPRS